jgi:MSHA type pilus biogenesis protein MshL
MRLRRTFSLVLVAFFLHGCSPSAELLTTEAIDPAGRLSREDYLALRDRLPSDDDSQKPDIPPIPKLPYEDDDAEEQDELMSKLISVDITDSVPVREVLLELMRKSGANLELDPRVHGSVILSAKNQPLEKVLKRICNLAKLRYTIDGTFIRIEPDEPYQKSYRLDYLSLARRATSDTSISTNVFDVDVTSGSGNASTTTSRNASGSAENNSTSKVSGVSEADFWAETERSILQILDSADRKSTGKPNHSLNKQAGLVTIFGDQRQHTAIEKYLKELRQKASAQVLIDARIIEVELDESYQSGIDWAAAFNNSYTLGHDVALSSSFGRTASIGANGLFTAGVIGGNFGGILNLVQTFGTTRVLSAPRVTVLNNQTAVMKVATNQVYFVTQAQFTTTTNANGASVTTNPVYTSTPRTVPVGLVMTVQPSIDQTNNTVTMTLRPTISRVVDQVDDPSIGLNAAIAGVATSVESKIPVLAVREMDSVIQLRSGEIAILGGLMQDASLNEDKGIPGLADAPIFGNLFKSRSNNGTTSELVILLRATISEQPQPDGADSDLYHTYNRDPRPLKLPRRTVAEEPDDEDLDDEPEDPNL